MAARTPLGRHARPNFAPDLVAAAYVSFAAARARRLKQRPQVLAQAHGQREERQRGIGPPGPRERRTSPRRRRSVFRGRGNPYRPRRSADPGSSASSPGGGDRAPRPGAAGIQFIWRNRADVVSAINSASNSYDRCAAQFRRMPGPRQAWQAASVVIGLAVENQPVVGLRRLFGQGNHLKGRRARELGQALTTRRNLP